jgi:chromosome segregation protein
VTAPARLLALRLQGFKSFAERTVVEFGPGISAVVGPNGSGKSNLADALRWALGEQGRALRSRKSEDVIFAGSDRRAALGMADVTLVLDNADAMLPVDFGVVELGRRLYRSGENDYLLNKQRIRLRDLVDLLDAAHLADNAFLFIGQGMVDQALALRPEERRPLFEEVAGVRRHERRRRKAEDQLVEAEANLARVDDILGELRPQARRLAAQAEQQVSRATAGDELAVGLIAAAHGRWHDAAGRHAASARQLDEARRAADQALVALTDAEASVGAISAELAARAAAERSRREVHEQARTALTELQLRTERLSSDLAGIARDRDRLVAERAAAESDLATHRRGAAASIPSRDHDLETAVSEAERALDEALQEVGALRAANQARGEQLATLHRAEAARIAELETSRRRLAEVERRLADERAQAELAGRERTELEARHAATTAAAQAAHEAERVALEARERARTAVEAAEGASRASAEAATAAAVLVAAQRGRVEAATLRLAEDAARGIARAARRVGGRRIDEELVVEPRLRAAVEAALGELARAYLVDVDAIGGLAAERGTVVLDGRLPAAPRESAFRERLAALGGGILADAVRRDPLGAASRILGRAGWVPDLAALVDAQADLPAGWLVVSRDGRAVAGSIAISLGKVEGDLERRAELERIQVELTRSEVAAAGHEANAAAARVAAKTARATAETAQAAEARSAAERRLADDADRSAGRAAEAAAREAAWATAQAERTATELDRVRAGSAELEAASHPDRAEASATPGEPSGALATWEARAADLRARRDRLAGQLAVVEASRREAESIVARALAAATYAEERIRRAETDARRLAEREGVDVAERARLGAELAAAEAREAAARAGIEELRSADAADRARLVAAESEASRARERLRAADDRIRAAEVADLEVRLGLESIHEQVLVELAGTGWVGEAALRAAVLEATGVEPVEPIERSRADGDPGADGHPGWAAETPDAEAGAGELEALLALALPAWAAAPPKVEPPPSGRLATLRRRFHELGAANPFAVEEYAELRTRLDTLEAQGDDLRAAIVRTRALIAELGTMISDQFQATFRALETAFDGRFKQLFGGGFARLELTDPVDLAATGVEIVARPPGKKAQALAMLSGGERALTAVALLFAMLEVRPVPFCVLDEVDAALDEANVGRFAEALRSLAGTTQFIVITHNRGTIETADALYGVTVGDDSVSRVISLRLDEATAIADRSAGNGAGTFDAVAG